jgi:hypothetical protein
MRVDGVRFRKLRCGYLIGPIRGVLPPAPEGYIQNPDNPRIYMPYNYTCDKRKDIEINNRACGCKTIVSMCLLNKVKVHPDLCKECTDETKSTKE